MTLEGSFINVLNEFAETFYVKEIVAIYLCLFLVCCHNEKCQKSFNENFMGNDSPQNVSPKLWKYSDVFNFMRT